MNYALTTHTTCAKSDIVHDSKTRYSDIMKFIGKDEGIQLASNE